MADLIDAIGSKLQLEYGMKPDATGKYLRKGTCPSCKDKSRSLWTWAAKPYVVICERANNCGFEGHVKELFPDLFESWTDRYQKPELAKPPEQRNPNAAAEAYLQEARGFNLWMVRGLFTQESYFDPEADHGRGAGTATVRFQVAGTWWERFIDQPWRFGKKKANFKTGGSYQGHWWALPSLSFVDAGPSAPADAPKPPSELWLVEGIFDAIALAHQVRRQLVTMARERQQSINTDHPLVQDFWEAFDYLNGIPLATLHGPRDTPRLNHSRDGELVAVNLNEFVELAAHHRQQVPVMSELKKVLRTSKTRRYLDVKSVNSAIKFKTDSAGNEVGRSVYCWVFATPGAATGRKGG